jgi:hypothetical protein
MAEHVSANFARKLERERNEARKEKQAIKKIQADQSLKFGVELLVWMEKTTEAHEHCCATGDCPHEKQVDCYRKLVEDCLEETQRAAEPSNENR